MHKKFEINRTKIKGGCKLGRKVVTHNSKSDLPLVNIVFFTELISNIFLEKSMFHSGKNPVKLSWFDDIFKFSYFYAMFKKRVRTSYVRNFKFISTDNKEFSK